MILRFEGVSYSYPGAVTQALDGLDLTVHPGESVLVAGSSGSGKSTFCRASIGLIPHFHHGKLTGRVLVDGCDTRQHPVHELFRHAGLVFQNPDAQLFNQTVEAELVYGLESLGMSLSEIETRLAWASGLTEIDSLMDRSPHTLSGGEKQRVALAAILTLRPRLLFLDEPFTHLDPEGTEALRKILRMMKSEGITLVIVEHRLHEVIHDVDRIRVLPVKFSQETFQPMASTFRPCYDSSGLWGLIKCRSMWAKRSKNSKRRTFSHHFLFVSPSGRQAPPAPLRRPRIQSLRQRISGSTMKAVLCFAGLTSNFRRANALLFWAGTGPGRLP
jgi:energy-coupling factor transporter ATP-binding protein EcfA2